MQATFQDAIRDELKQALDLVVRASIQPGVPAGVADELGRVACELQRILEAS